MPLYHAEVFMPKLALPKGKINLQYTTHAMNAAKNDRYGTIALPEQLDTSKATVIEVETNQQKQTVKVLYRVQLDAKRDLCLAVLVTGIVKTVWVNQRSDKHKTLQKGKYATR